MTREVTIWSRRVSMPKLLAGLALVALIAALLTPEVNSDGGNLSSYSIGPTGASVAFELAQRMGWSATRRETIMDSAARAPSVEVVIGPQEAIGRREIHHLLENVRRGGGLVVTLASSNDLADSLGLVVRASDRLLMNVGDASCNPPSMRGVGVAALPPTVFELAWRRPAPLPLTVLARVGTPEDRAAVAFGFPVGKGRVVAIGGVEPFANESMRNCAWGADIVVARAWEYARAGAPNQSLVFDEYHHGRGVHGGSLSAVSSYLARTASGRFFATVLAAGVLFLFAVSPRPIIPREPNRIFRRSPLEHADALGRAYADVAATRTASGRLVSGLRRRTTRYIAAERNADDRAFLDIVARRFPSLAPRVAILQRGLREQTTPREFALSADAIDEIERVVTTTPPAKA